MIAFQNDRTKLKLAKPEDLEKHSTSLKKNKIRTRRRNTISKTLGINLNQKRLMDDGF